MYTKTYYENLSLTSVDVTHGSPCLAANIDISSVGLSSRYVRSVCCVRLLLARVRIFSRQSPAPLNSPSQSISVAVWNSSHDEGGRGVCDVVVGRHVRPQLEGK